MPKFLKMSLAVGLGTVLFEFSAHGARAIDWSRCLVITLFSALAAWVFYRYGKPRTRRQPGTRSSR